MDVRTKLAAETRLGAGHLGDRPVLGFERSRALRRPRRGPRNRACLLPKAAIATASLLMLSVLPYARSARAGIVFGERSYDYQPSDVVPDASRFERKDSYWEAYRSAEDGSSSIVGYVFLTDDLIEIPGYSGHTLNTLVGMDLDGKITGIKIVRHSEPIVLIGLSEQVIHDFVGQYVGKDIRDRVIISDTPREGYIAVHGITGATVTAVAENATVLEASRSVGRAVGMIKASQVRKRRPSVSFEGMSWEQLVELGAIGEVQVSEDDVGLEGSGQLIELIFTVLDPPTIGENLLGERFYAIVGDRLQNSGGSAIYVGARGGVSFKGAGFARGGIFDRFSIEQAGGLYVFKDVDYINFPELEIEDGPAFGEGGVFFIDNEGFDPTEPFTFHLTLPYRIADKKAYATFLTDYEMPPDLVEEEVPFWVTRWQDSVATVVAFACFLALAALLFAFRQRLLPYRRRLHYGVASVAVVWLGLLLKAQPSTTQILTLANSTVNSKFPLVIFLSEPLIFLFWITIVVSLLVWGRGFFCGWLCPYGALLEIMTAIWGRVAPEALRHRIDSWEPGAVWRSGKYVTFLVILAVALVNLPAAEMLDEVEPFKTFILKLARPLPFVAYFVVATLVSGVVYRFFCRFLCPLGGALAIPSRRPLHPLVRYEGCSSCKICYRGCEPRAISKSDGRINYAECLQCWDCQMTAREEDICPELIRARKRGTAPRFLLGLLLVASSPVSSASAEVHRVWPGPNALTKAISESSEGDTLVVEPGFYFENVVVDKRLTIKGEEGAVVDAGGQGHVLVVSASGTVVEGLTLRGSGTDPDLSEAGVRVEKTASDVQITGNHIERCRFGVWVHGSERTTVLANTIEGMADLPRGKRGDCIHLWAAKTAFVRENRISECRDGIYMELSTDCQIIRNDIRDSRYSVHTMWCDRSSYNENLASENLVGLALMFSKHIQANRNTLYNNATHGVLLTQVTRAEVLDNIIIGNTKGLFVYNSLYNTIRGNLVASNNLGMHYWGGSEENEMADNAFVDNEIQVKFVAAHDQTWHDNYWSDYVGWDIDGNGRGDLPYHSNTLVDVLLWKYPVAKLLLSSPAFQVLAMAEREFPVISVPKGVDETPRMEPLTADWAELIERYPPKPKNYYGTMEKLPHIPGEDR